MLSTKVKRLETKKYNNETNFYYLGLPDVEG